MAVRHAHVDDAAGAQLLAADDEGNFDALARHALERFFELRAFGAARRVGEHGLIDGSGDADIGLDHFEPPTH